MSAILGRRWTVILAAVVAMIAITSYLVITLGVVSGARAASDTASLSAGNVTSTNPLSAPSVAAAAKSPATLLSASAGPPSATPEATPPTAKAGPKATTGATTTGATTTTAEAAAKPRTGASRRVTFVNRTAQKIWVAGSQQTAKPALGTTGWVLPVGKSLTISVPNKWNGRFWGRTGCTFNSAGWGHCVTGDCDGLFQCKGFGLIPATLAEYNFDAWQGLDFYDVSMVDGSNLPMYINHTGGSGKDAISKNGCLNAGCTTAVNCPKKLVADGGAGCESPCAKIGGAQFCCQGKWAPRSACDPTRWPIDYAAVFKKAEPFAYSYVDDDATSTFTCQGRCDYRITFGLSPK